MQHRIYHAFKWQTVVEEIKINIKGIVLLSSSDDKGGHTILNQLSAEEKSRVVLVGRPYNNDEVQGIIYAANKPKDTTWVDWIDEGPEEYSDCLEHLRERTDSLPVSCLVLVNYPNRTKNTHKIIADTKLMVISTTPYSTKTPIEGDEGKCKLVPDVRYMYGRPALPDFNNLSDEEHDLYLQDSVYGLDDLIPIYDCGVQSLSFNQLVNAEIKERAPLVLMGDTPMLWSESITELFAWRGTGKTLFSLALGLHLAAGKNMPGFTIPAKRNVLYVEGELPASQLQHRIKQLSKGLNIAGGFTVISKAIQRKGSKQSPVTIATEAGRLAIEAEIEKADANA